MVPIHDTDIAEERWSKAEWESYELWEQIELRLRRRKELWIAGTVLVFLAISSIPIFADHWPKWTALSLSRKLAQTVNHLKREAAVDRMAYRIRFHSTGLAGALAGGALTYTIERATNCSSQNFEPVRTELLSASGGFALDTGSKGLVDSFCYDSLLGSDPVAHGAGLVGFGIAPVKDLAVGRSDRLAVLLISGPSAELSFE